MSLQLLPRWITLQRDETPEAVAFLSGAALATLDAVIRDPNGTLPCALLRDRMALDSAVACLKLEGRNESGSDIRDAVCLARAGDRLGPAGGCCHINSPNLQVGKLFVDQAACAADFHASNASSRW